MKRDDTIKLKASPSENSDYRFIRWSDGKTSNVRTDKVNKVYNKGLKAIFAHENKNMYTLTVSPEDSSLGDATGSGRYTPGEEVTILASPKIKNGEPISVFTRWSDGDTNAERTITMTGDVTLTAVFTAKIQIQVKSNRDQYGTALINDEFASKYFNSGETATIKATPNAGYVFECWDDGNTDNPRQILVTNTKTYKALFSTQATYCTITTQVNPSGSGSVVGGGTYAKGSNVSIKAVPAANHQFVSWDDGNTNATRIISVTGNKTYIAQFQYVAPKYSVSAKPNDPQQGKVIITVDGAEYSSDKVENIPLDTPVSIEAQPREGFVFVNWNDGSRNNPRSFDMPDRNLDYIAVFTEVGSNLWSMYYDETRKTLVLRNSKTGDLKIINQPVVPGKFITFNPRDLGLPNILISWTDRYGAEHAIVKRGIYPDFGEVSGAGRMILLIIEALESLVIHSSELEYTISVLTHEQMDIATTKYNENPESNWWEGIIN